jgi:HSP20 family protein
MKWMDMDKLKQWLDIAQNMHGADFWKTIFDQDMAGFMDEQNREKPTDGEKMSQGTKGDIFPPIDILENDKEVIILVEIPGVKKEDIELGLNGDSLFIKGVTMQFFSEFRKKYSERFYGEFQRSIKLPNEIKPEEIQAKFWNGLLIVSYTKPPSNVQPINIE